MEKILVCNGGSSSLKVACYVFPKSKQVTPLFVNNFSGSPEYLLDDLQSYLEKNFPENKNVIVLHRIVHAGAVSEGAIPMDDALLKKIAHWQPVAPLHNSLALKIIAATQKYFSDAKHFAFFDSGLFSSLPALARFYALPTGLSKEWPVQRYGFHGLAHRSQWNSLQSVGITGNYQRVITLQLGSGCSAAAWRDGKVMDTSMGFSPLEGLTMATRSGSIDPGILLHLLEFENYTVESLRNLLNKQAGILGLSDSGADREQENKEIKRDIKDILRVQDEQSLFAVDYFCYQVSKMIGAYAVVLGGLDAISFGGGIAEHNPHVREKILCALAFMGLEFDKKTNQQTNSLACLHKPNSQIHAWLTPVDEMQEMLGQFWQHNKAQKNFQDGSE